jgi:CRISPR/Cas system CMR-associated protein Cmr5 small subunit
VVTSDDDEAGLSLDILNEIRKCPKELFDLLPKEKQKDFRVQGTTDEGEETVETLMRRYSDRFPYFALRFCDDREVFEHIRFHIDLGRYYFDFYDKKTIDGGLYPRSLDKQLKTFGRIRDVRKEVERQWDGILKSPGERDEDSTDPYKARTTPHYHIVDNQIGFVLNPKIGLPDISKPDGRITLCGPDAWLSVYELPGMLFYGLRCGFDEVEKLLAEYINEQKKICRQVQESGRIENNADTFLPEALKNVGVGNETQNSYVKRKLERMLAETEQRLSAIKATEKRMADPGNKPGKKNFFDIRAGKLADFLVRDILAMQAFDSGKEGSDKLTSINFQVLQATIAYWGAKREQIGEIFKASGLLDGENPHPFLKRINFSQCRSISEFYKTYLREKEGHLRCCQEEKKYDAQFLRPSRERYAGGGGDLKTIAGKLLEHPVNIPKRFFEDKIRELVCGKFPPVRKAKMNTAYLIQAWFEKTYGGVQPVYSCVRTYPVVLKAGEYAKKRKNGGIKNALRKITPQMGYVELNKFIQKEIPNEGEYDPERLKDNLIDGYRDFENNERLLRRMKVQDMILFMMAEEILKEQLALEGHALRLEHITPTENSPFKRPIVCKTSIPVVFSRGPSYEHAYIAFIEKKYPGLYESNDKRVTLRYQITSKNTKFGDMGKYRRYLYDRRLKGLLVWKYPPNAAEITYDEIQKEIEAYEKHRVEIFRLLYQMEKAVIDGCKMEPNSHSNYIPFKDGIVEKIKEKHADCAAICDTLVNIRNAVNHNQFPAYDDAIEQAEGVCIAEKMKTITGIYVDWILKKGFNHE